MIRCSRQFEIARVIDEEDPAGHRRQIGDAVVREQVKGFKRIKVADHPSDQVKQGRWPFSGVHGHDCQASSSGM